MTGTVKPVFKGLSDERTPGYKKHLIKMVSYLPHVKESVKVTKFGLRFLKVNKLNAR